MSQQKARKSVNWSPPSQKKAPSLAPPAIAVRRDPVAGLNTDVKMPVKMPEYTPLAKDAAENHPLLRQFQSPEPIQRKLSMGTVGDKYEQEADRVAKDVVREINTPAIVQRDETEEKIACEPMVQRDSALTGETVSQEVESAIEGAASGGQSLDPKLQSSMGEAMGADFSRVRVHTDSNADRLNQSLQAKAFTTGQNVFFRQGAYQPASREGQELIAHELTHVVQQNGGGEKPTMQAKKVGLSASNLMIQRAAKKSHYGTFTDRIYEFEPPNTDNPDKLRMTLEFEPNDRADATKVGLVQTIKAVKDDRVAAIDPNAASKMTAEGHRVDRLSEYPNPIYATKKNPNQPNNKAQLGAYSHTGQGRYAEKQVDGTWSKAMLNDGPTVSGGPNSSKVFESTAIAVEGNQAGSYYGSVKWGWERKGNEKPSIIPFDIVSKGVPSANFLDAAAKWNQGKTRGTHEVEKNNTDLENAKLNGVNQGKQQLSKGDKLRQEKTITIGGVNYIRVIVLTGALQNYTGSVRVDDLKDSGDGNDTVKLPVNAIVATFEVAYKTNFGEDIYVHGNKPELGDWDRDRAEKLDFVNVDPGLWRGVVRLNEDKANQPLEYKYLVKEGDRVTRIEEGGNHRPGNLPAAGQTVNYKDTWDDGH
ncbi:MAG: DUF4157 domain-containing protein [Spirulina sp.]